MEIALLIGISFVKNMFRSKGLYLLFVSQRKKGKKLCGLLNVTTPSRHPVLLIIIIFIIIKEEEMNNAKCLR